MVVVPSSVLFNAEEYEFKDITSNGGGMDGSVKGKEFREISKPLTAINSIHTTGIDLTTDFDAP